MMRTVRFLCLWSIASTTFWTVAATAQTLVANDDAYAVPFGQTLDIEAFGILDNDTLDDESAGESGATAELVSDVSHGTLALGSDGAFTYSPGPSFDGSDAFTYRAVFAAVSSEATVTLTACGGGPQIFACWKETAFLAKAAELGLRTFTEGFENDAVWGAARSPNTAPSVTSKGIHWQTNHPDPPASNELTTGPGPALTGAWGVYDADHGYATGTPGACDIDMPPPHCLYHDGFTGVRQTGRGTLHGAGGYFRGIFGANVAVVLDGDEAGLVDFGKLTSGHQFFGVIDVGPTGFSRFEFRETDGKVGQALFIWADDFTFVAEPGPVPSMSARGLAALGALLALAGSWLLAGRDR